MTIIITIIIIVKFTAASNTLIASYRLQPVSLTNFQSNFPNEI